MAERLDIDDDPRLARKQVEAEAARDAVLRHEVYALEHPGHMARFEASLELSISESELSRRLRWTRPPLSLGRKRRSDFRNTDAHVSAAMSYWWDKHGAPPSKTDWSPQKLRHRSVERLARFRDGWVDANGEARHYPRADRVPFDQILRQLRTER